MINIVLVNPEIPPNTGNIIRLCANTGYYLHLIKPIGFDLKDKQLKRAGLDYHDIAKVKIHDNLNEFIKTINDLAENPEFQRIAKKLTRTEVNIYTKVLTPIGFPRLVMERGKVVQVVGKTQVRQLISVPSDNRVTKALEQLYLKNQFLVQRLQLLF